MIKNSYFTGNGLYQSKLDKLVKTNTKSIELTAINEMYCIVILMLREEAGENKVKQIVEKYKDYVSEYGFILDKLIEKPSYNLAEWVFDFVILDMVKKWI